MSNKEFSHIDDTNQPTMVDVSGKSVTNRTAIAQSRVVLGAEIIENLDNGDISTKKGPVFATAIIAGTMGAKKTSELIPFCHPLAIENCKIDIVVKANEAIVTCKVSVAGKTGVEMEAITGASIAAITIYDMCKAISHGMEITQTRLISKTGGKSDINILN